MAAYFSTQENMTETGDNRLILQVHFPQQLYKEDVVHGVVNESFMAEQPHENLTSDAKRAEGKIERNSENERSKNEPTCSQNEDDSKTTKHEDNITEPSNIVIGLNPPNKHDEGKISHENQTSKITAQRDFRNKVEAWSMVVIIFLNTAMIEGNQYSLGVFFIEILREFDSTNAEVAWISSLFQLWIFLIAPLAGFLLVMYGPRIVCYLGAAFLTVGLITSKFATQLWHLYITMGILPGIGTGLLASINNTILCYWFDKNISLANGIARCGSGAGILIFPPLVIYLISEFGWRDSCLLYSGLGLQCLVFSSAINPRKEIKAIIMKKRNMGGDFANKKITEMSKPTNDDASLDQVQIPKVMEGTSDYTMFWTTFIRVFKSTFNFKICRQAEYSVFVIANMVGFLTLKAPFLYTPARTKLLGISQPNIGWIMSGFGIAIMLGGMVTGLLADLKVFKTKRLQLLVVAWLICGLPTAMNLPSSFPIQVVLAVIYGFGFGAIFTLQPVVVRDMMGIDKLPTAYGLLRFVTAIPSLIGAPLLGLIYDLTENYTWLFVAAGVTMCVSAAMQLGIAIVAIRRRRSAYVFNKIE